MAGLRQKRNGRFYAECVIDGHRHRRSLGTRELSVACDRYASLLMAGTQSFAADSRHLSLVRLGRWYVDTVLERAPEPLKRSARSAWLGFLDWARENGIVQVTDLTASTGLMWYGWLVKRGYPPSSASAQVAHVRAALEVAVERGLLFEEPVGIWPGHAGQRWTLEDFAALQVRQVLNAVRRYAPEVYPLIVFLSATAWRFSGVLGLIPESCGLFFSRYGRARWLRWAVLPEGMNRLRAGQLFRMNPFLEVWRRPPRIARDASLLTCA